MYRIDDANAAASLPALPTLPNTPGYFQEGVAGVSMPTPVRAYWLNMIQEEIISVLTAAGLTLDKTNNGQLLAALQKLFSPEYAPMLFKSTAYTILAADAGSIVIAGAVAITLPATTGLPADFPITIYSSATGTTILPNSATVALASGNTTATIPMPAATDFLSLRWDATNSLWRVVGGSPAMFPGNSIVVATSVGGTANAITATIPANTPANALIQITFPSSNTTATTISFNGGAPMPIAQGGTALSGNEIVGTETYIGVRALGDFWLLGGMGGALNVGAGSAPSHAVNVSQFGNTLAANGHQNLPGGLILQWFTVTGVANNTGFSVTFPNAFPNHVWLVQATVQSGTSISYQPTVNSLTNAGFTLITPSGVGGTWNYFVFAIGN